MRRFVLILTLALTALTTAPTPGDAARPARQCPEVKVSCPDTIGVGEQIEFNAAVDVAAAAVKLNYKWELSAGSVAAGQGASSMKADTAGLPGGQTVTATVEVAGLAAGCGRKASCTTAVLPEVIGCGLDEYGDIAFDDEKARLDNFAIELQNDPTAEGYLTCYGGRRGYAGEALRRCERAKEYVANVRGIEASRLVTVDGGFREDLTVKLVLVPAGAKPPQPTPTVDPREVVIIKGAPVRKTRPR
jgi:hypothetical protein